jgi:hypothetical protein
MSDDIFHSWKNSKFVMTFYPLVDEPNIVVILTDIKFWAENIDKLIDWCQNNDCGEVVGSTVTFSDYKQATMFALRWS